MCIYKYRLVIKGLPEDEAVLCTHDQTFSLRQVNTSNYLLQPTKYAGEAVEHKNANKVSKNPQPFT